MSDLKTYCVDFAVRGYKAIYVQAKDVDEATELATDKYYELDFGCLEDVDCKVIDAYEDK